MLLPYTYIFNKKCTVKNWIEKSSHFLLCCPRFFLVCALLNISFVVVISREELKTSMIINMNYYYNAIVAIMILLRIPYHAYCTVYIL